MGEVIVGHGVHFVMCSAYLGLFLCGKVWFGVWYRHSMVWHGYRGVIAGQAEKGEQRFMGGSRGRLGLPSPGMSVMSQDRDSAQAIYL